MTRCPFVIIFEDKIICPYMISVGFCDDLELNPGNGDSWCSEMIEKGLEIKEQTMSGNRVFLPKNLEDLRDVMIEFVEQINNAINSKKREYENQDSNSVRNTIKSDAALYNMLPYLGSLAAWFRAYVTITEHPEEGLIYAEPSWDAINHLILDAAGCLKQLEK